MESHLNRGNFLKNRSMFTKASGEKKNLKDGENGIKNKNNWLGFLQIYFSVENLGWIY